MFAVNNICASILVHQLEEVMQDIGWFTKKALFGAGWRIMGTLCRF